jgi:hypothetical protein
VAPDYTLHPQSLVMETLWVAKWFERLLKKQTELVAQAARKGKDTSIFIADRSPVSPSCMCLRACVWGR